MEIYLEIQGKPIAKARPRFFRRGNFVGTYNPQNTEEGRFLFEIQSQLKGIEGLPITRAIGLKCAFYMPIPKSISKKARNAIENTVLYPHIKRPDLDNLLKFLKDCLNQGVWKDDSLVADLSAIKVYGEQPRTEIRITY